MEIYIVNFKRKVKVSNEKSSRWLNTEGYAVVGKSIEHAIQKTKAAVLKSKIRFFDDENKEWLTEFNTDVQIVDVKHEISVDLK